MLSRAGCMLQIGGLVVLFVCVFGGFIMSGGSLGVVIEAVPHEVLTIGGAATAALLIGGSMYTLKKMGGDISKIISGPKWKPSDYRDLLCLLYLLTKTMKTKGLIALEAHIERPEESSIFKRYPKIGKDHFALSFICDTLRMMTMSLEDPSGRNGDGKAARKTSPRNAGHGQRAADDGRRVAGAWYRRRRSWALSRPWARFPNRRKCWAV